METFGTQTAEVIIHKSESHKLNQEFVAAAALVKGQFVKLNSTGQVVAFADGDNENLLIGYTIHSAAAADDLVTVTTRGYAILRCQFGANSSVAGPVESNGIDTSVAPTGLNEVVAASATTKTIGWALAGGDDLDEVLVLVKD